MSATNDAEASHLFTMFSNQPTTELIEAIEAAGIVVRGWEIPAYSFKRRKTFTHTLKIEGRGWIDPRHMSGNLKLTVHGNQNGVYGTTNDPVWIAFEKVVKLGGAHGVWVGNGGMVLGE
jgi:hypothetical protein